MATAQERQRQLQQELSRYLQQLQGDATVQQVIVFGSLVTGEIHPWSDIDLVVIQETPLPFWPRIMAMRRRLQPRVGADILVYTPGEFQQLCQERLFFQQEVLPKARVMHGAQQWFGFADEDLQAAEVLLQAQLYGPACFHSQQAVEKALKGLLVAQGQLPPSIHTLQDLLNLLALDQTTDWPARVADLDGVYLSVRYPDAVAGTEGPDQAMASQLYRNAKDLVRQMREQIA
ncbi:HEPN domain-containing protein [Halomicronema hongdechloris]|nr:HEPN domain-containing protein [Halomicronema hongdechloris]